MKENIYVFKERYDNFVKEGSLVRISKSFTITSRLEGLTHLMVGVFGESACFIPDQELHAMIRQGVVVKI